MPTVSESPGKLSAATAELSKQLSARVAEARAGAQRQGEQMQQRRYADHVGLFSEEIALTGEQIGNFPQAFTHLAAVDAASTLNAALDERRAAS